jgi:hypothetical protein
MSAMLKKLQKEYTAVFGNAPRGRSCKSEAWLKDQIEQRVVNRESDSLSTTVEFYSITFVFQCELFRTNSC